MNVPTSDHIRPIDQTVLELLRQGRPSDGSGDAGKRLTGGAGKAAQSPGYGTPNYGMTVQELTEELQVTATAVRHRLERLVELDLVQRRKESIGRGRPQFRYCLTVTGMRYAAASYADLATALWQEVMELPNPQQRSRVLRRVAKRMGSGLKDALPKSGDLDDRLAAAAAELAKRKIPAGIKETKELPVLEVHACPYPELTDSDESRQLCEIEQEMLSEAIGQSVQLDCCRLDGHDVCQFRPVADAPSIGTES